MNAIKATWKEGRIVPDEPVNWPEGCEVVVEPLPAATYKTGLDESEWRDDYASRADWESETREDSATVAACSPNRAGPEGTDRDKSRRPLGANISPRQEPTSS